MKKEHPIGWKKTPNTKDPTIWVGEKRYWEDMDETINNLFIIGSLREDAYSVDLSMKQFKEYMALYYMRRRKWD